MIKHLNSIFHKSLKNNYFPSTNPVSVKPILKTLSSLAAALMSTDLFGNLTVEKQPKNKENNILSFSIFPFILFCWKIHSSTV